MLNKNNINENQLDELFRNIYLDEKSRTIDEDAAQFIMDQEYSVKPNAAREQQLIEKLSKKQKGFGTNYSFFVITLSALFVAVSALFLFLPKNKTDNIIATDRHSVFQDENNSLRAGFDLKTRKDTIAFIQHYRKKFETENNTEKALINDFLEVSDSILSQMKQPVAKPEELKPDDEPLIPVLSENDKVRCRKIKELMLSKLVKADKGLYTHISADKMNYAGQKIIVDAYTMRNFSVSNLEYKTFLNDLLMQNRKEEFVRAGIRTGNWGNYGCGKLANSYFSEEKYNDFPVVNVTREGARLFCEWLEDETQVYIKQNKLKAKSLQIRLPYDTEWIYAAWMGYTKISSGNSYNTIFDPGEGLVEKSFTNRLELIKKRAKRTDTLFDQLSVNTYGWTEKDIAENLNSAFRAYSPAPADTIFAERMKFFGRKARVSQMAVEKKSERMWFIGLGWKNKEEYEKMQNEFKAAGASPFVGFRYVIINSQDSDYKNPFW